MAATASADDLENAGEGSGAPADLAGRYERAIQEYVAALDAGATREFEAGRFLWHEQGMPLPAVESDEIISVRRAWEGRYRVARMGEAEYSELHRLRSDVLALAELLDAN